MMFNGLLSQPYSRDLAAEVTVKVNTKDQLIGQDVRETRRNVNSRTYLAQMRSGVLARFTGQNGEQEARFPQEIVPDTHHLPRDFIVELGARLDKRTESYANGEHMLEGTHYHARMEKALLSQNGEIPAENDQPMVADTSNGAFTGRAQV